MQAEQEKQGISRLRRRTRLAQSACIALGLLGLSCVCVYLQPDYFGISKDQPETQGWLLIWLVVGVGLLGGACFQFTMVSQWTKRLLWIRQNMPPSRMRLIIEADDSSGSTAYCAWLKPVSDTPDASWCMRLWAKPRDLGRFLNTELQAKAYVDPESGRPAVVDFDHGILWSTVESGSTKQTGEE